MRASRSFSLSSSRGPLGTGTWVLQGPCGRSVWAGSLPKHAACDISQRRTCPAGDPAPSPSGWPPGASSAASAAKRTSHPRAGGAPRGGRALGPPSGEGASRARQVVGPSPTPASPRASSCIAGPGQRRFQEVGGSHLSGQPGLVTEPRTCLQPRTSSPLLSRTCRPPCWRRDCKSGAQPGCPYRRGRTRAWGRKEGSRGIAEGRQYAGDHSHHSGGRNQRRRGQTHVLKFGTLAGLACCWGPRHPTPPWSRRSPSSTSVALAHTEQRVVLYARRGCE